MNKSKIKFTANKVLAGVYQNPNKYKNADDIEV